MFKRVQNMFKVFKSSNWKSAVPSSVPEEEQKCAIVWSIKQIEQIQIGSKCSKVQTKFYESWCLPILASKCSCVR